MIVDLNYLFHRHQMAIMQADAAASPEARVAHDGMARGYLRRIEAMQAASGAAGAMRGR